MNQGPQQIVGGVGARWVQATSGREHLSCVLETPQVDVQNPELEVRFGRRRIAANCLENGEFGFVGPTHAGEYSCQVQVPPRYQRIELDRALDRRHRLLLSLRRPEGRTSIDQSHRGLLVAQFTVDQGNVGEGDGRHGDQCRGWRPRAARPSDDALSEHGRTATRHSGQRRQCGKSVTSGNVEPEQCRRPDEQKQE
jgi:hypothetical protein